MPTKANMDGFENILLSDQYSLYAQQVNPCYLTQAMDPSGMGEMQSTKRRETYKRWIPESWDNFSGHQKLPEYRKFSKFTKLCFNAMSESFVLKHQFSPQHTTHQRSPHKAAVEGCSGDVTS